MVGMVNRALQRPKGLPHTSRGQKHAGDEARRDGRHQRMYPIRNESRGAFPLTSGLLLPTWTPPSQVGAAPLRDRKGASFACSRRSGNAAADTPPHSTKGKPPSPLTIIRRTRVRANYGKGAVGEGLAFRQRPSPAFRIPPLPLPRLPFRFPSNPLRREGERRGGLASTTHPPRHPIQRRAFSLWLRLGC